MMSLPGSAALRRIVPLGIAVLLAACAHTSTSRPVPDDAVRIGYGELAAELSTASIASLSGEQIRRRHVNDVGDLFETMPGVTVVRSGGRPSLRVRTASTASNAAPLVIIDGVPLSRYGGFDALAGLAPQDIERIDVIKDGATAMYGVRGGHGVVLITTRLRR